MVGSVATTRYTFTPHLRVPPTVERACGEISQASQIRTDGSSRLTKLARRTAMGPARHPHCAQRRYRVFVSRAGLRSVTDSPGRFRPSWAGYSGCSTVPSATPRDRSRSGTETVNPARHQSVVCAVNSGTQRLCLCAPRLPPSTPHTAVRGTLQGLDARREVVRARLRQSPRQRQHRSAETCSSRPGDCSRGR